MKLWILGGAVVAGAVAAGVYFTPTKTAVPTVVEAPPAPAPAGPVVADVVNVTDIDALLDPPQIPVADAVGAPAPVVMSVSADHVPAVRTAVPPIIPAAAD